MSKTSVTEDSSQPNRSVLVRPSSWTRRTYGLRRASDGAWWSELCERFIQPEHLTDPALVTAFVAQFDSMTQATLYGFAHIDGSFRNWAVEPFGVIGVDQAVQQ